MGFSNLSIRNRITSFVIAITMGALLSPSSLPAQEKLQPAGAALGVDNAPVVVVTVASINKLMQDVNYLSSLAGQPQAGGMFQMMAGTFTQGIDMTQPIAVLVPMVNGMPEPIAVIPTANVKTVLKRLEAQTGPVDELDDGTLVIAVGPNVVYIRQVGNWAIAARSRDVLSMAPADPTTLFTGMGNSYDLAFRVKMQQIPAETRDMLTAQLRQGFEQAMAQQSEEEAEATRKMAEGTLDQIQMMIEQSDEINFGWNVDQTAKEMVIDFSYTALQGTKLASLYGNQKPIPSAFGSVIRDDAAGYMHVASSISPEAVEMTRSSLNNSLGAVRSAIENSDEMTPDQQAKFVELINRLADLYVDSVSEGKVDMGGMLLANEDDFRFVFGGFVSDGNEAAQIVKDLAAEVEKEVAGKPDAPRFKFDQGQYNGVTMHVIEADVPAREEEARRVFGEMLQVHIGTGPKAVYLAVGKDSESTLKKLIDAGGQDAGAGNRPLGQVRIKLLPILQFAQSVDDNEAVAAMITTLTGAADPGVVTVISDGIANGTKSRFTVGEGLIKAIGAAAAQAQQQKAAARGF
ncbi:hypothetical protein [Stieleria marina]|uniref:Uncharacterized protein n=1 Tax=Stieleria marina TaxID=1930275 RepID=A0A517NPU6_9BACT|nr:hypothetical protein K239x_10910 [Planctomycetes bacterium K23_9]